MQGISEITVKAHRGNVMRKMKADSFAHVVKMASRLRVDHKCRLDRPIPFPDPNRLFRLILLSRMSCSGPYIRNSLGTSPAKIWEPAPAPIQVYAASFFFGTVFFDAGLAAEGEEPLRAAQREFTEGSLPEELGVGS
jgi:Bacterial regulatory proteins, luxR family